MSRPKSKRIMEKDEFLFLVKSIIGPHCHWLDRIAQLTAIDKATLQKYGTGERPIANTHALFLRQIYLLHVGFPDLASDINFLAHKPISRKNDAPEYNIIKEKAALMSDIANLKGALKKIGEIALKHTKEINNS